MMKVKLLLITVLIVFSMCSCNKPISQENKVNITLLHGFGGESKEDIIMRKIYKEFEEKNTDISLTLVSVPSFNQVLEKAKDLLVIGKAPNIIYNGNSDSGTVYKFMVEKGYALNLMPYIENDSELKENTSKIVINTWKEAPDALYTVTDVLETKGYWYNKEIFKLAGIEKIPGDYNSFVTMVKKINYWSKEHSNSTVAVQLTDNLVNSLTESLNGKNNKAISIEISDFLKQNNIQKVDSLYKDELRSFNVGHSAVFFGEVFDKRSITNNMKAGFESFPIGKGLNKFSLFPSSGYIISNWGSKDQEEASIRFIKYMLSKEVQEKLLTELYKLPSNPNIDIELVKDKDIEVYNAYKEILSKYNPN